MKRKKTGKPCKYSICKQGKTNEFGIYSNDSWQAKARNKDCIKLVKLLQEAGYKK